MDALLAAYLVSIRGALAVLQPLVAAARDIGSSRLATGAEPEIVDAVGALAHLLESDLRTRVGAPARPAGH